MWVRVLPKLAKVLFGIFIISGGLFLYAKIDETLTTLKQLKKDIELLKEEQAKIKSSIDQLRQNQNDLDNLLRKYVSQVENNQLESQKKDELLSLILEKMNSLEQKLNSNHSELKKMSSQQLIELGKIQIQRNKDNEILFNLLKYIDEAISDLEKQMETTNKITKDQAVALNSLKAIYEKIHSEQKVYDTREKEILKTPRKDDPIPNSIKLELTSDHKIFSTDLYNVKSEIDLVTFMSLIKYSSQEIKEIILSAKTPQFIVEEVEKNAKNLHIPVIKKKI